MNNDGRWQKGTILSSLIHHFPIRLRHSLRVLLNIVAQCSLQSIIRICKDVWIYLTFLKPSFWDPRFSKPLLFALLWLTFNEATLCSQWNHMFDFSCSLRLNRIQLWFKQWYNSEVIKYLTGLQGTLYKTWLGKRHKE